MTPALTGALPSSSTPTKPPLVTVLLFFTLLFPPSPCLGLLQYPFHNIFCGKISHYLVVCSPGHHKVAFEIVEPTLPKIASRDILFAAFWTFMSMHPILGEILNVLPFPSLHRMIVSVGKGRLEVHYAQYADLSYIMHPQVQQPGLPLMFSTTSYQQTPNQVRIESHFEITIHKHPDGFGRPLVFIARGEPKSAACHKESFGKEGAGKRLSIVIGTFPKLPPCKSDDPRCGWERRKDCQKHIP